MTIIFIPAETRDGEKRVAGTPSSVKRLVQNGFEVIVEQGAGLKASILDRDFESAGAKIISSTAEGAGIADIVTMVNPPERDAVSKFKEGSSFIGFIYPHQHEDLLSTFCSRKVSAFAMESIPRITRAQKLDALSSQSNIAGYQAVLLAAQACPKIFPQMTTAAGTLPAARVVIIGAGVAGLQAIATARRLGAVVEVSDVRPAVKEQVQSLGAIYIDVPSSDLMETKGGYAKEASAEFLKKQGEITKEHLKRADAVICSALVPGKKAPVIISAETVGEMKAGSVIIDMAAEQGGNCALTVPGETVTPNGVIIIGAFNLPSQKAFHSSEVYGRNILNLLLDQLDKEKKFGWKFDDEVVDCALLTHQGEIRSAKSSVDAPISANK